MTIKQAEVSFKHLTFKNLETNQLSFIKYPLFGMRKIVF